MVVGAIAGGLLCVGLIIALTLSLRRRDDSQNAIDEAANNRAANRVAANKVAASGASNSNQAPGPNGAGGKPVDKQAVDQTRTNGPAPAGFAPTVDVAEVQYKLQTGKSVQYHFEITAGEPQNQTVIEGENRLTVRKNRSPIRTAENQKQLATGSGFVVHPSGLIVTCDHVVSDAGDIVATIDGRQYAARVIGRDPSIDIAFLKIDADGLAFLTLADSDKVRLADEVRAIGFPLSDILGESVKVTRGEVSGRGGFGGMDSLQIDATVNPGNSGGPVINNAGSVVGVATSLLAGFSISEVGIAVPSNAVADFAKQLNLPIPTPTSPAPTLRPADLIAKTTPATVFLKVDLSSSGENAFDVMSTCRWDHAGESSDDTFTSDSGVPRLVDTSLNMNESGITTSSARMLPLPYLLGDAARIGVEILPSTVPGRVTTEKPVTFQFAKKRGDANRPRGSTFDRDRRLAARNRPFGRLPSWPVGPMARPSKGTQTTTTTLSMDSDRSTIKVISKITAHADVENVADITAIDFSGNGEGRFDPAKGEMVNYVYRGTIVVRSNDAAAKIPVTMSYQRVDGSRLAKNEIPKSVPRPPPSQAAMPRPEVKRSRRPSIAPPNSFSKTVDLDSVPASVGLPQFDPNK